MCRTVGAPKDIPASTPAKANYSSNNKVSGYAGRRGATDILQQHRYRQRRGRHAENHRCASPQPRRVLGGAGGATFLAGCRGNGAVRAGVVAAAVAVCVSAVAAGKKNEGKRLRRSGVREKSRGDRPYSWRGPLLLVAADDTFHVAEDTRQAAVHGASEVPAARVVSGDQVEVPGVL